MKAIKLAASLLLLLSSTSIFAADAPTFKWYGFIRNYFAYNSRECKAGTADLFTYLPLDRNMVGDQDINATPSISYSTITSRLGVDVSGYEVQGWKLGAKIETDFYSGLSGVTGTATLRLRQAYMTAARAGSSYKIGQAWHPMAADMPDVFSLNTGAPFGPFSRTPLVQADYKLSETLSTTAAAIWQMQYTSAGPDGASANYMKYAMTPELYAAFNIKSGGFSFKIGANMLSIKPRKFTSLNQKASDRITTFGAFAFVSYAKDLFSVKAKTYLGQGGEHLGLNSGYAVAAQNYTPTGSWNYTPLRNSSSWISFKYGKDLQAVLFAGYFRNFGTSEEIFSVSNIYFSKNSFSSLNRLARVTPSVIYNMGKLALGLEYEYTVAQYGSWDTSDDAKHALATKDLHWVSNNRIQLMVKYTF